MSDWASVVSSNRWVIVGPCAAASVVPSAFIAGAFAAPGALIQVLPQVWLGFLLGPLCEYYVFPGSTHRIWVWWAVALVPALLAHCVYPRAATAVLTVVGFVFWYGLALLVILRATP
jgi:hypothetical protein